MISHVKVQNPPDMIQTEQNRKIETFVLLIKASCGGNALYIFRGDVSRAGRNLFRRPCSSWQVGIRLVVIILQGESYISTEVAEIERHVSPEGCVYLRISAYPIHIIIYHKTWSHINIYINYHTIRTSS